MVYLFRDTLAFTSHIFHAENSEGEGLPAKIRVITPLYVKYVEGSDEFKSNYTVKSVATNKVGRQDNDMSKMGICEI